MALPYFDLFEIPVQLIVKKEGLSAKFFSLSRKYHPDYYVNDTEEAKAEALEKSAMLNKAYKTFQDAGATIKYVLQEKGLLEEEEKFELPPEFLMEVMEINEAVMDADNDADKEKLLTQILKLENVTLSTVEAIINNYQEDTTTTEQLLQVKEYYYKKKYIERIRKEIAG
jgi:molecular chaperone HscB